MSRYIVSDEHKFVYFVVPKVACSSIKVAMIPLFDLDTTNYRTGGNRIRMHWLFTESGYELNRPEFLEKIRDGEYQDYLKFAFVRNPWDRLVSCWRHKLSKTNSPGLLSPPKVAERVWAGMPFSEFVEIVADTPDAEANLHFKSQSSAIYSGSEIVEQQRPLADFIGSFENIQADFDEVVQRLGVEHRLQLGHFMSHNKDSNSYVDFYDEKLKDLVQKRYLQDIKNFGYSF